MSQLTMVSVPGSTDIDLANLAALDVVTEEAMVGICQNAKFAAVRAETIFMGFYKHGDTIAMPVSPVDGYAYSRSELLMDFSFYSSRAPDGSFVSGQADAPGIGAGLSTSQTANIYWTLADIDDASGVVSITVSYYRQGGAETITHDGVVKVYALCQRQSVNVPS